MADQEMVVTDAPVTAEEGSGVAADGNISTSDIAGLFAQAHESVESEVVSEEGEGEAAEQATNAEPETDEDSSAEDATEETEDTEEESDESEESEDDDVLSKLSPKAADKARKRIDKLTARAKGAEEELERRTQEIDQMRDRLEALEKSKTQEQDSSDTITFADRVQKAETPADLQSLEKVAKETREWCRRNLHKEYAELGKDESGEPRVIEHEEIADMLAESERVLEEAIPGRQQYLKKREVVAQNALRDFPAWKDTEHPDHKRLLELWNDPAAASTFHNMPNGVYLIGVLNEGLKVMEARQKGEQVPTKEPEAKKAAPAKKEQKIAPKVPGVDAGVAPTETKASNSEKHFQGQTSLSMEDLVAYWSSKEEAKRNQKG